MGKLQFFNNSISILNIPLRILKITEEKEFIFFIVNLNLINLIKSKMLPYQITNKELLISNVT